MMRSVTMTTDVLQEFAIYSGKRGPKLPFRVDVYRDRFVFAEAVAIPNQMIDRMCAEYARLNKSTNPADYPWLVGSEYALEMVRAFEEFIAKLP